MLEENRWNCANPYCDHISNNLEAHHIYHYSKGGSTTVENGITLCQFCHILVHKAKVYYESKGFEVIENYKTFDILIRKGNMKAVVEIETGKSNPIKNIKDAINQSYAVVSAATNSKAFETIKKKMIEEGLDKRSDVKLVLAPRAYNGKANGVFKEWFA